MKKIISIIAMALVALVACTAIVFTFVPKDFNIGIENPSYFIVYNGTETPVSIYNNEEQGETYDKIIELYNSSFKTSLLNSLFQGKIGISPYIIEKYQSLTSNDLSKSGKVFLEFRYDSVQTLKLNGQKYTEASTSETNYVSIILEVLDSSNLTEVNAYLRYKEEGTNDYSWYRFVTQASQSALFDYLQNL